MAGVTSKPSHSRLAATLPALLLLAGLGLPSTARAADAPAPTNTRPAVATTNGTPAVTSTARAATNTTPAVTNLAPAITQAPSGTDALTTNDWESALRILHSTLDSLPSANPKSAVRRPPSAIDPPSTNLISSTNALDDKRKLAIGDRLSLRIVEDLEDPKPLFVTDSGDVEVPYIGRVPAVDKTCHQLAQQIKAKLEEEYYYQATVIWD